jgi:chromate transporter
MLLRCRRRAYARNGTAIPRHAHSGYCREVTPVSFADAARTWMRIGLLSFGGPAGQIAVMHRILVDEKRWIDEPRFLHALNYCMLLPGPEAQQLATYVGWLLHGTRGGLTAGLLFVLPGFVAIMAFSFIYVLVGTHPLVAGMLLGLKAAVIALVIEALARIARRALAGRFPRTLAVLAFVAMAILDVPFPAVIAAAALAGFLFARGQPGSATTGDPAFDGARPGARRTIKLLALWLPLWFTPVALCALLTGPGSVFTDVGVFFSKMAVVTFGGAYAVLTYVAQQAVERFAWVTPAQMIDGLGLAESTPGPLILVVQFVGFLAAYQAAGDLPPLVAGVLGALLTVWVTFVPCFLWIFLGAPYVERLRGNIRLAGALSAITAAVVGVIANLALWFATHALFGRTTLAEIPGLPPLELPLPASLRPAAFALTVLACVLLFGFRQGLGRTVAICAAAGAIVNLAGLA